jgi:hypothetical protein
MAATSSVKARRFLAGMGSGLCCGLGASMVTVRSEQRRGLDDSLDDGKRVVAQSGSAIIGSVDLQRVNLLIAELVDVIVIARIETWGREDGAGERVM